MDQAALDIRYSELLQWLLDRYLIPKDWPHRLEIIKTKKTEVLDMLSKKDSDEMKKIQKNFGVFNSMPVENVCYNDFGKLYSQLTKTQEAKDLTFFGNYSSPFLYAAYILDKLYNKNNLHLAENSKIIIQNITYEIPNSLKEIEDLKDQKALHENKMQDKENEMQKNKEKINSELRDKGIELNLDTANANQIAMTLIERLEKDNYIERYFSELENSIKDNESVKKAMDVYEEFYAKLYSSRKAEKNSYKEVKKEEKKSTKKKGKKTKKKEKDEENTNNNENNVSNIAEIADFKFETFTPKLKKFQMSGDYILNSKASSEPTNTVRKKYIEDRLNKYKLKYTDKADLNSFNFSVVSDSASNANVKSDTEILETALTNHYERNLLTAEINEIIIFISERIENLQNKDEINLAMYNTPMKEFNMKYSSESLSEIKENLLKIIEKFSDDMFNFIVKIFDDESSIKDIVNDFDEVKIKNMKLKNQIEDYKKKNTEIDKEMSESQRKINELRKNTVTLKKISEVAITKLLKRKVNIMGSDYLFAK